MFQIGEYQQVCNTRLRYEEVGCYHQESNRRKEIVVRHGANPELMEEARLEVDMMEDGSVNYHQLTIRN